MEEMRDIVKVIGIIVGFLVYELPIPQMSQKKSYSLPQKT